MTQEKLKPLSAEFFSNLVRLEADFINKNYTASTLDELVEYYSDAVEYYDSQKDQIAAYWIYKIQDTLAQKKSLKLLTNENAKSATPKENIKDFFAAHRMRSNNSTASNSDSSPQKPRMSFMGGVIAENLEEENSENSFNGEEEFNPDNEFDDEEYEFELEDEDEGLSMAEKRMRSKNRMAGARKSIATLKKKTQKLFTLQMKLQNEKASVRQTLSAVMGAFHMTSGNNDKLVAINLGVQRKNWQDRLHRRLNPAIYSHEEGAGSTIFIDGNEPNLGVGFINEDGEMGGSSL